MQNTNGERAEEVDVKGGKVTNTTSRSVDLSLTQVWLPGSALLISAPHSETLPPASPEKKEEKKELHTLHNAAFMLDSHNGASSFTHVLIVLPWMRKGCSLQTARLSSSVVPANSHPCCPLSSVSVWGGGRGTE